MDSLAHIYLPTRLRESLLFVAFAGFSCYLAFKRFEPVHPLSHVALLVVIPAILSYLLISHTPNILTAITLTFLTYTSTLLTSLAVYRLSPFHPMAKYPGPIACKLSKFWMAWISWTGKQHLYYKALHDQYGSIVRIGPNEVSICDPAAITPLMGPSGLPKGPMWEGRFPSQQVRSLIAIRDPHEHGQRRRRWNRAFNTISLKGYEPTIVRRASQLIGTLAKRTGPVDIVQWVSYFTYDFMSDMAFGGGSEMMRYGDKDGLWHIIESGQPAALFLGHVPWLGQYYIRLPSVGSKLKRFRAFGIERAIIRQAQGSSTKDLFHHLMDEEGLESRPPTFSEVVSDGGLAIIAGSDTTATALSYTIWNLLRNSTAYTRLQAEVDEYFPAGEEAFDTTRQASMEYLGAVINEALRLLPPVLTGSQRAPVKGSGERVVGSYALPEGSSAFVHPYSLHRDPSNFFPMPDVFWPERWIYAHAQVQSSHDSSAPTFKGPGKLVHNTAAFIPFSFGPAVCVGKNLALQEIRMVICLLVQKFEMRFAEGFTPETWEDTLQDYFVTTKGPLPIVLKERNCA